MRTPQPASAKRAGRRPKPNERVLTSPRSVERNSTPAQSYARVQVAKYNIPTELVNLVADEILAAAVRQAELCPSAHPPELFLKGLVRRRLRGCGAKPLEEGAKE